MMNLDSSAPANLKPRNTHTLCFSSHPLGPKISGTLGEPMTRIVVFFGLDWGPRVFGSKVGPSSPISDGYAYAEARMCRVSWG